jgi:hypothetical protein
MGTVEDMAVDSTALYGVSHVSQRAVWMLGKSPDAGVRTITPAPGLLLGIAIDDAGVYWNEGAELFRQPKPLLVEGGVGTSIATLPGDASAAEPGPLVLNGLTIYWSDTGLELIATVPTAGGTPKTLVSGVAAKGLFVRGPWLYFTDGAGGTLSKVPLDGGAVVTIVPDAGLGAGPTVTDGANVYWLSGNGIWYVPLDGGAVAPVFSGTLAMNQLVRFTINSQYVYWTDSFRSSVMRAKLPAP